MDKKTIGTNAGIIWNLLYNGQKWNCKKLMEDSGLSEKEVLMAIGWLAREDKIEFETCPDGSECYYLIINYF